MSNGLEQKHGGENISLDLCNQEANSEEEPITSSGELLIPISIAKIGGQALVSREKQFRVMLSEKKWPKCGWDDLGIEMFIQLISAQDSNNFIKKAGVGERESRIYSGLVSRRHYAMGHGVGRSGDLAAPQPKAVGSTIVGSLANSFVLELCRMTVSPNVKGAFVVPMATGMTISLALLALRKSDPSKGYVVWLRADQKSCFKAICITGLKPIVVEGFVNDTGSIQTGLTELEEIIKKQKDEILCIISTTSCFAPRACDNLPGIAKLCKRYGLSHVVNNAYGLQSEKCCSQILEARKCGRLDIFVQSTDKNLMVPVGGAIVAGFNERLLENIRELYPGRASSSPSLDVLITMLSMGSEKYYELRQQRIQNYNYLRAEMEKIATKYHTRIVGDVTCNDISIALELSSSCFDKAFTENSRQWTELGSMLFHRNISGARVVTSQETQVIEGHEFKAWGAHSRHFCTPYLTAAATIGMQQYEVDMFITKLDECLHKKIVYQCKKNPDSINGSDLTTSLTHSLS